MRNPAREFIVREGAAQHEAIFFVRHDKPDSVQRPFDIRFAKGEVQRGRRRVIDRGQVRGQVGIQRPQNLRCRVGR